MPSTYPFTVLINRNKDKCKIGDKCKEIVLMVLVPCSDVLPFSFARYCTNADDGCIKINCVKPLVRRIGSEWWLWFQL